MEKNIKNIIITLFVISIATFSFSIGQLYGSLNTTIALTDYINTLETKQSIVELQNNNLDCNNNTMINLSNENTLLKERVIEYKLMFKNIHTNYNNQDERFEKMLESLLESREEILDAEYKYALCYEGIYPHRKEFNQ